MTMLAIYMMLILTPPSFSVLFIDIPGIIPTVILVQETPYLVDLDEDGRIQKTYGPVPSYFTSDLGHDDFVTESLYHFENEDLDSWSNIQWIPFGNSEKLLDQEMVDRLRQLVILSETNNLSKIAITVPSKPSYPYEMSSRLRDIISVLEGFGLSKDNLEVIYKKFTGTEEFRFYKVETTEKD